MCDREQRGLAIAAMTKIKRCGYVWVVPSQSGSGKYSVSPDEQSPYCSCPDFETRGVTCKHIFAVRFTMKREQHSDGSETITESVTVTETVRKTYPQKWKEYNEAQKNEKDHFQALLRSLCDMIKEPNVKPGRGRPKLAMSDCVFMSCFKVYSTVSQRRFMCDLDDATEKGYLERTPHYNAIGASLEGEAMTPVLMKLIAASSLPLKEVETDFAVDSTGFTTSKFYRWYDHKYGKVREDHDWVKLHAVCGVKTNVITAVEIHERNTNDCPLLPSLLAKTAENFTVNEMSADKQYASRDNFDAINAIGADAYIPFKANATGSVGGMFQKAFHFFSLYREDFLKSYHKRSNIESTFSMLKRKHGDSVRSKTEVAMKNEVLCKVLCHNICCLISAIHELGIQPVFDKLIGCTFNREPAQEIAAFRD
jgi:transposase/predicted nucleic acid-binding Zn finger protein